MSSCSRQYASRHISGLKKACESTSFASVCSPSRIARQQPLLFLYPSWFQQRWHRQYHTDRATGRDQRHLRRTLVKQPEQHLDQPKHSKFPPIKRVRVADLDPVKPSLVRQKQLLDPTKAHYRKTVDPEKVYSVLSAELDNIEPAPPDKTVFIISRTQARKLVGHEGAENWIHHEDSGCIIKITPRPNREQSTVGLNGSDRACELAKKYVLMEHPEDMDTHAWKLEIDALPERTDVLDLPNPTRWSIQTLSIYIDALIKKKRHFGRDQVKDEEGRHHNARIATTLVNLFNEPETAPFSSSSSFEKALKFCKEHTELARFSRDILDAARKMKLPLGVGAYNEELKRHLITKNDRDLEMIICAMRDNHIKPNNDTWTIVLQYARSPESRFDALEQCLETGKIVLSEQNGNLISTLINTEMINYLAQDNGVTRFMEDMDRLFGESWLTTRALTRMLRICRVKYARVRDASELLQQVSKRRNMAEFVDGACLVELVRIAKKAGNLGDALEVVLSNLVHAEPTLYQSVLEPLFEFAWLKKSLNLCRLLWIFACTWGKVSFRMKDIMWHSMQGNIDQSLDAETKNWQRVAGKLIITQPRDGTRIRKALPELFGNDTTTSVLAKMIELTTGDARHEQLQLTQLLIERDMQAWRFYHSIPLVYMRSFLREFHMIDDELRLSGIWNERSEEKIADHFLARLPPITLKPRDEALQYRQEGEDNPHRRPFFFNGIPLDYNTLEIDMDVVTSRKIDADVATWESPVDDKPQAILQLLGNMHGNDGTIDESASTAKSSIYDKLDSSTMVEPQSPFPLSESIVEGCDKSEVCKQSAQKSSRSRSKHSEGGDGAPHESEGLKLSASASS